MTRRLPRPLTISVGAAALALAGCGGDSSTDAAGAAAGVDGPRVLAAFYPLEFVAREVGGPDVSVATLTKPGAEPHDLELTPQQVGELGEADVVVYLKGFQPAVDAAIEQAQPARVVDVTEAVPLAETSASGGEHGDDEHGDEHGELAGDPHVWLDPTRLAEVTRGVATELAAQDQSNATAYQERADALVAELTSLDEEFAAALTGCERTAFVTSHAAFGYLADRYGLEQVAISGLSPEAEPSPARIAEVQEVAESEGVTTIFYETLVSPKVAETLAGDLGLETAVLDPLEGLAEDSDGDYLSVMRDNLAALRAANGCG